MLAAPGGTVMCGCEHTTGDPDCPVGACRTRWLVGSTTGEPFVPCPLGTLILDILETHYGEWHTPEQILSNTTRIRPDADVLSAGRLIRQIDAAGGGMWWRDPIGSQGEWADQRGRVHAANGNYLKVTGRWVKVDSKPDPLSFSTDFGFLLRVSQRTYD